MSQKVSWRLVALCALVALMAGVVAALGVFARGDGSFAEVVSVRGETYLMATSGVYAYNAQRVVAEGVGWDIFTLFGAVPALLLALPALAKGSLRAKLFVLGLLGYFFYQYLMYAMAWALGPLLLPFIAIYAASLVAMVGVLSTISLPALAARVQASASAPFPRRGMAALCLGLALVLLGMWLSRITATLQDPTQGALDGQTTLVVQALDLGLIVPLALFTAVAAWRGRPVGYLLSAALVVKAVAMGAAICAMLLSAWAYEGVLELPPLILFGAVVAISVWLGVRMYRSVGAEPAVGTR